MTTTEEIPDSPPKRGGLIKWLIVVVAALIGGGGSFFLVSSGVLFGPEVAEEKGEPEGSDVGDVPTFIAIPEIRIALGSAETRRQLLLKAHIETKSEYSERIELLFPRIVDVLNTYLRAVDLRMLEDPRALIRLRAQMLHRVQIVVGPEAVTDFLITEFVLS